MTLKFVQLPLHLSADDAYTLIDFLNQIQDLLWASYGKEIEQACRTDYTRDESIPKSDFDDPLLF